jgi:hypothetical protein
MIVASGEARRYPAAFIQSKGREGKLPVKDAPVL